MRNEQLGFRFLSFWVSGFLGFSGKSGDYCSATKVERMLQKIRAVPWRLGFGWGTARSR